MERDGVEIVTGFSAKGYAQYGWRLVNSFLDFRNDHRLVTYCEGMQQAFPPQIVKRDQDDIPEQRKFLVRYFNRLDAQGLKDPGNRWKQKEIAAGYSFRFDAYKFCRMVFIMNDAIQRCASEYMIWLDGDSVIRKPLPNNIASKALPHGYDYAYLGRTNKYSETGFLVFRTETAKPLLQDWADYYALDAFLEESEWHSAYLFDRARALHPRLNGYNLTPEGKGHPIHQCWVGSIIDHCKGNRKFKGRSPEAR